MQIRAQNSKTNRNDVNQTITIKKFKDIFQYFTNVKELNGKCIGKLLGKCEKRKNTRFGAK